jgi:hypothetical protein
MIYKNTTQVPNFLFDKFLPELTEGELKVILVVIRQTIGWVSKRTGLRKTRDWITGFQFRAKTGLSKRVITKAIQSLITKQLLQVTDYKQNILDHASMRKGKTHLYFSLIVTTQVSPDLSAQNIPRPVHQSTHNKTNYTKTKVSLSGHIGKIILNPNTNEKIFRIS